MDIRGDMSTGQIRLMVQIYNLPRGRQYSLTELARTLTVSPSYGPFRELVDALLSCDALQIKQVVGSAKLVAVNRDILADVIHAQEFVQFLWDEFLEEEHLALA